MQLIKVLASILCLLVLAGGIGAWVLHAHHKPKPVVSSNIFPTSVTDVAHFPLYYPVHPPSGLAVNRASLSATSKVVTYVVNMASKTGFYVSVQPLPQNYDFDAFEKKFQTTDEFTTSIGTALVGDIGVGILGSVRTNDGSWILINSSNTNAQPMLEDLIRSLQKVT
jgi:hypothetical protein